MNCCTSMWKLRKIAVSIIIEKKIWKFDNFVVFNSSAHLRDNDIRDIFRTSGFDYDPEREVFDQLSEDALGNIAWV